MKRDYEHCGRCGEYTGGSAKIGITSMGDHAHLEDCVEFQNKRIKRMEGLLRNLGHDLGENGIIY